MTHPLGNTGLLSLNLKYTTFAETPLSLSNTSDVGFFCVCVCVYIAYDLIWNLHNTIMNFFFTIQGFMLILKYSTPML